MTTAFTLIPSRYEDVVPLLKARAPEFLTAPEYLVHQSGIDDLPGVFAAAFAAYVSRVAVEGGPDRLPHYVGTIAELAEWSDGPVDEALRDEVFDRLHRDADAEAVIRPMMSGRLREMYDDWLDSSEGDQRADA